MSELKDKPNSVEFSINAKGVWSGKVKTYREDTSVAYTEALYWANEMEKLIRDKNE